MGRGSKTQICVCPSYMKYRSSLFKSTMPPPTCCIRLDGLQVGMFYYSDLTPAQGEALADRHHVYILASSGRINLGAVTQRNVGYVAAAIADVVTTVKK